VRIQKLMAHPFRSKWPTLVKEAKRALA
jgi:hypothetical protein